MPKVELGIHSGHQDIGIDEVRAMWKRFDEGGLDFISVWDHLYESPYRDGSAPTYEALTLLTTLALDTSRCRVSCLCFGMAYRNPALLAKALTLIDHLSNGRLTVGLGAGWHVAEHEAYGYEFPEVKERLDRLSEGTRIGRSMFDNERTTFEGKYYRVNNVANNPRPLQAHIPIIVGGGGEKRTMALAARYGDGTNQGYMTAESYAAKNKVADEWCEKLGRDPKTLERSTLLHWRIFSKAREGAGSDRPPGAIWGESQQVIDQLAEYVDAGAARISLAVRPPLDWDAIEMFIEDVIPAFQ